MWSSTRWIWGRGVDDRTTFRSSVLGDLVSVAEQAMSWFGERRLFVILGSW